MAEPTDQTLLEQARAGDTKALEELLARHQTRVFRYGLRMCGDKQDAEDVLQNTLLAMARGVRDFRGESSISTWLYTVAHSFCIKKRRRSKFAPTHTQSIDDEQSTLADPSATPEEQAIQRQLNAAVQAAIGKLDASNREVLVLRDVEGLSAAEVADVLGISVDAVKSRLHRARLAVRQEVAPLMGITPSQPRAECPDVLMLFSQHLENDISASVCEQMDAHLKGCAFCQDACNSLKHTLKLCKTSPTEDVPASLRESVRTELRNFLQTKHSPA